MLTLFCGNTGTGKSYAMMDKIKKAAQDGKKVCVIVPDQFTFEYEHMLYNHLGCSLFNRGNTEVWSFSRLTADIFRCTGMPKGDAADSTVKTSVMYRVIKETAEKDGLLFFGRQAKRPSFVNTALTMISELAHSGVTPSVLGDILKNAPDNMKDKLTDLFLIYSRYADRLAGLGLRDKLEDTRIASQYASEFGYFSDMCLFMDEFKSFTGDQYGMIAAMLADCSELTVCMTTDDIRKTGYGPFTAVNETCGRLISIAVELMKKHSIVMFEDNKRYSSETLYSLSKSLMRIPSGHFANDGSIIVAKAPDLYGECDYVCAEIKRITAEDKDIKFSDIAVLSRSMNDDISVLSSHFERYGIPYYSDKKASAGHKPLMLMVTAALELVCTKNISTETLLRYVKTGLTDISSEEISQLENYCYTWDIDGAMWKQTFPDEACEDIKNRILAPVERLKKQCANADGEAICNALREFIISTGAEERLLNFRGKYITEAESAEQIRENVRLCTQLDEILSGLENSFGDEEASVSDFREIFMLSAAQITLAKPPDALDGVAAQQSDLARLGGKKIVFVIHANDGIFPFVTGESSTFSEREREFFKNAQFDLSGSMKKRMAEERFNAFKALTAPSDRLYISYSAADTGGAAMYPSALIDKLLAAAPDTRVINTSELDMLFFCRTEEAAYAAAAASFDPSDISFQTVRAELCRNPVYARKFGYIDSVNIGTDHRISDTALMRRLYGKTLQVSASRFEDYEKCPFMYFCKTGLRLYPRQKMDLNPINQGNIMHNCMKDVFENNPKENFMAMSRSELSKAVKQSADGYIRDNFAGGFSGRKSFDFYMDIMTDTMLIALTHMQEEMKASDFVPDGFELPVGTKKPSSSVKPVIIECGEELRLNFTGTADRVDTYTDENGTVYIRILDYKTGIKEFMTQQLALGINMQMFFYLFALTDSDGGRYSGCVPAGALYLPVKFPKLSSERNADEISEGRCIDDTLKMQGAVLDSPLIIDAMENDCTGRFIPVKYNKNGTLSSTSCVLDSDAMNEVKALSVRLLDKMGRGIYSGEVPASPLECKKYKCSLPCNYCDYREVCGNYPNGRARDISDVDFGMFDKKNDNSDE